jgi:pantetheine-phosphate adenylyltransferase
MALMNRKLQPGLETVFMMPAEHYSYISSRLVREIAAMGGPVGALVPGLIEQRLRAKFKNAGAPKKSRSKATAASSKRGKKRTPKP